jgi:hypothetical protein
MITLACTAVPAARAAPSAARVNNRHTGAEPAVHGEFTALSSTRSKAVCDGDGQAALPPPVAVTENSSTVPFVWGGMFADQVFPAATMLID